MTETMNTGNNANTVSSGSCPIDSPYYTTVVGEFQNSTSAYGTYDQCGNVWEYNESVFGPSWPGGGVLGGSFANDANDASCMTRYADMAPTTELSYRGFRVGRIAGVPEPSSIVLLLIGGAIAAWLGWKRRR
jgi:formylglycine-generating enzyme